MYPRLLAGRIAAVMDLLEIYRRLYAHFGPQHWWPADAPFEVVVGAILTQNTSWKNVERALANLKAADLLDPARLRLVRTPRLARLIRPSGSFNGKAKKIKALLRYLDRYGGRLDRLFRQDRETLREELLAVYGIGPETADSILLYAGNHPSFVVDAYTRRIFGRLGWPPDRLGYAALREACMAALPPDVALYNEYHALLVAHGKSVCTKRAPRCAECPLADLCPKVGIIGAPDPSFSPPGRRKNNLGSRQGKALPTPQKPDPPER